MCVICGQYIYIIHMYMYYMYMHFACMEYLHYTLYTLFSMLYVYIGSKVADYFLARGMSNAYFFVPACFTSLGLYMCIFIFICVYV